MLHENEPEYINFYEELPADDPAPDPKPDPAPDEGKPAEGEPANEPDGGEGGEADKPVEGEEAKPKKDPRDQPVPFGRYQKALNEKKELERQLAEARGGKPAADDKPDPAPKGDEPDDGAEDEPELDERSQKAVEKLIRDKGYITREEVDQEKKITAMRAQVEQDTKALTTFAEENGYPSPNVVELDKWADENLGKDFIKNEKSLKAAYYAKYADEIRAQDRKAALADAASGNATGERPGAPAKATPVEEVKEGRGFLKNAIHKAREEIDAGK